MVVPLPPLVAVTLGALGAALIVRHFTKQWQREAELQKVKPASRAEAQNVRKLRRDPDGIYRP